MCLHAHTHKHTHTHTHRFWMSSLSLRRKPAKSMQKNNLNLHANMCKTCLDKQIQKHQEINNTAVKGEGYI